MRSEGWFVLVFFIIRLVATDVATQVLQFNVLLNKLRISLPLGI